jgi:D-aspartate ligase
MAWPHIIVLDPYDAGLALARPMVRLGARVTLILEPNEPFAGLSRGVRSVITPFGSTGESWVNELREIARSDGDCVVLTATDRGSELLVRARDALPEHLRTFEQPGSGHMDLMDKERADSIARRAGVRVPWTACVNDIQELTQTLDDAPWPCVVKPILSHEWRARYGEVRAFLAKDSHEGAKLMSQPLKDGLGMLLSQYIPGEDSDVEEAIVVRLADGSYPVWFGCRKLRQYPPGFGVTSLGEASLLPETMTLAKRVLDEAGFVGVAGVEAKRHAETSKRWFLEVNVRLPAQWGLGDTCGVKATPRLVAALAGQPLRPQPALRTGARFVHPDVDWHVIVPAVREAPPRRRAGITWRLVRPYIGASDFGMFDWRDPAPALAFCRAFISRRLAGLTARMSRKSRDT